MQEVIGIEMQLSVAFKESGVGRESRAPTVSQKQSQTKACPIAEARERDNRGQESEHGVFGGRAVKPATGHN